METLLVLGALALLARGKHPADAVATGDKGSGGGMTTGVYKGPMTRDGRPCPPEMIVDLQCIKPPCGQMCNEPVLKGSRSFLDMLGSPGAFDITINDGRALIRR